MAKPAAINKRLLCGLGPEAADVSPKGLRSSCGPVEKRATLNDGPFSMPGDQRLFFLEAIGGNALLVMVIFVGQELAAHGDLDAVIVGGARGLGFATAQWLARRGATTLMLASRRGQVEEALQPELERLRQSGVTVEVAAVDVAVGNHVTDDPMTFVLFDVEKHAVFSSPGGRRRRARFSDQAGHMAMWLRTSPARASRAPQHDRLASRVKKILRARRG